jgi:predicted Fe-Mo cluster-binding NifX family protein
MKIAVASDNQTNVSGHLGRVNGFIFYEVDGLDIINRNYVINKFTNHVLGEKHEHHHGEGESHGHSRLINALNGVDTLIFQSGGWRVIEDLKKNGIKPFLTDEIDADNAVKKFLKGELLEKMENVCNHH